MQLQATYIYNLTESLFFENKTLNYIFGSFNVINLSEADWKASEEPI